MNDRSQNLLIILAMTIGGLSMTTTGVISPTAILGQEKGRNDKEPGPAQAVAGSAGPVVLAGAKSGPRSPNGYPGKPFDDFWGDGSNPDLSAAIAAKARAMDLEFLVMMAADPIDSRFGYRFDGLLDDVEMAIESQGWSLDRFWLPWQPSGKQTSKKDQGGLDPSLYEQNPGVMLFRKDQVDPNIAPTPKLLILFIVGETPTGGVHKGALTRCFNIIRDYKSPPRESAVDIRIIGPYFTGTQRSLALAISEWASGEVSRGATAPRFHLRTGGANRVDKKKLVEESLPAEVDFDSTVLHFDSMIKGLMHYLKERNRGASLGKVALLTESDTAFGNTKIREHWTKDLGIEELVQMKFPFHISQVAIAYDQNKPSGEPKVPVLVRSSSRLSIPFDETGTPRDVVPSLSPGMAAVTDEFVLSKILETISAEDFRYVGIVASDTRDVLFLAGLIREFCPDVQLFTTSGDLLLAHPAYSHHLRGTIVASSYPMFSMAQRWDPPYAGDHRRHLFSHECEQGYFNAALSLLFQETVEAYHRVFLNELVVLGLSDLVVPVPHPSSLGPHPAALRLLLRAAMIPLKYDYSDESFDYGPPFDEMDDLPRYGGLISEYDPRSTPQSMPQYANQHPKGWMPPAWHRERPPLWLGVVGQRGLWPLEAREVRDPKLYVYTSYYRSPAVLLPKLLEQFLPIIPQYHWIWGTMFLALSAVIWAIFLAHARVARAQRDGTDGGGDGPPPSKEHRRILDELLRQRGGPLRNQQEVYFYSTVAILAIAYGYCVWLPCSIALFKSPWRVFLYRQTWAMASWGDCLNCLFSLSVLIIATATSLALLTTFVSRLRPWWTEIVPEDRVLPWWAFPAFAAGVVAVVVAVVALWPIDLAPPYDDLLFFERAVNLGNGVSPLVPVIGMTLVCAIWLASQQLRLTLVERQWVDGPFGENRRPALGRLWSSERKIHDLLTIWFPRIYTHPSCAIGLGVIGIAILRLIERFVPTVDGYDYCLWMIVAFCFLACVVLLFFFRFVYLWRALKTLLHDLALLPMLQAYDRLPGVIARSFGRYLDAQRPRLSNLTLAVGQWQVVARDFDDALIALSEAYFERPLGELDDVQRQELARLTTAIKIDREATGAAAARTIRERYERECQLGDHVTFSRSEARTGVRDAAAACLVVLPSLWALGSLAEGYAEPPKDEDGGGDKPPKKESALVCWRREAEDLVALEFIAFVGQCTVHLRNLAMFLAVGPILLSMSVASYPFQPQRFLMVFGWTIVLAVALGVMWVVVEMEHNEFLSRVAKTEPGRMTFDRTLIVSILTYILPLIGILIAQFPEVSDQFNQWLEPIFRVLK